MNFNDRNELNVSIMLASYSIVGNAAQGPIAEVLGSYTIKRRSFLPRGGRRDTRVTYAAAIRVGAVAAPR